MVLVLEGTAWWSGKWILVWANDYHEILFSGAPIAGRSLGGQDCYIQQTKRL